MEKPNRRLAISLCFAGTALFLHFQARAATPYPDSPYRQLVREFHTTSNGLPSNQVRAVAATSEGTVFAVAGGALMRREVPADLRSKTGWRADPNLTNVSTLFAAPQAKTAYAGRPDGVSQWLDGRWENDPEGPRDVIAFSAEPDGTPWALAPSGVWRRSGRWALVHTLDPDIVHPNSLLPRGPEDCLIASESGLFGLMGKRRYWLDFEVRPGGLLSRNTRSLARVGNEHWLVTTDRGFNIATATTGWAGFSAAAGLPILDLTVAAISFPAESASASAQTNLHAGTIWLGSEAGLIRWQDGQFTYLAGRRWLPDDRVSSLAVAPDRSIWVGTQNGLAHLIDRPMTLADKAAILQTNLENRDRRHGYVTEMHLPGPGILEGAHQEVSDNDGLWTSLYIAAQSFRYAVTRAGPAQAQAWRSMQAMLRLESATGIPGFPARAICSVDEPQFAQRSIRSHPEWHPSPVETNWFWKGETSSDEIDGHYFGWYVFFDLAAEPEQKRAVAATCKRVTDHILDHGYYLVDHDGKPTTWGVWAPEKLNDDPIWWQERGLGSLEMLSHLKVAFHLTGEERYARAYRELIEKHHYALNTLEAKLPSSVSHDNQLLFLAYYPLLQLERDPALRALYASSLTRTWNFQRVEANPLWNFIYGASLGAPCDSEQAVEALREMPLDFVLWKSRNSHRADLRWDRELERQGIKRLQKPLPWTERVIHKWDKDPFELDGGNDVTEGDPTVWLLPYWMGRFHGLVAGK